MTNWRFLLPILLATWSVWTGAALAQSTATPVVPGFLTTSGCPANQTTCFVQGSAAPFTATNIYNGANGFGSGITGTSSKFALTGLPANSTLVITNTNTTDGIYILLCPTSTCTATALNGQYIGPGSTGTINSGANTEIAGISSGSGPDVTTVAGGYGTWNGSGGGSGGSSGGAVTLGAGAVAAGAYVAGSVLSGAYADCAIVTFGCKADTYDTNYAATDTSQAFTKGLVYLAQQAVPCQATTAAPSYSNNTPNPVSCDLAGNTRVAGAGTAGSPSGGVLSVQGVAGGTPQPVTVSAQADPCFASAKSSADFESTSSGGNLITGTTAKITYICSIRAVVSTQTAFSLCEATSTACSGGTPAAVYCNTGTTAANGCTLGPNSTTAGGIVDNGGGSTIAKTATTGQNVDVLFTTTNSPQVNVHVTYVQQ